MTRTTTLYLGITGGSLGIIFTLYALYYGTTDEAVYGESFLAGETLGAILISTAAIVGASLARNNAKAGGWIMLLSGLALPVLIDTYGFIPLMLLLPAGISNIIKRKTS
ncbi:hypothetical protein K8O68_20720 [Salipaludibacillus sp. CUR1]|uniref:hypothetical protein n=1 Tax=Salipaludibacillus sp. CUR1 TaxID=2820003 RepID=UPI001E470C79|nr:hypothetical protein [Salipaludibacillus sp. CUR1]MCE7794814.1 hypothetical protein [Salipaludibacillus sp. CUR1]